MISRIFGLLIFLIISPILIMFSIVIFIDDGFPVFFKQKRFGINNSIFWIYKFRTMKKETPDLPTHLLKNRNSSFTYLGPFFRKYSIDELPQLINIVKGEMGFIGPRPALHNQEDLISLREKKNIQKLLPGITGWAQVNGRDRLTLEEKVEMESYYLENRTLFLDFKIIVLSILKVIKSEDVH